MNKKISYRTVGDVILFCTFVWALLMTLSMNVHKYDGLNKGYYIGSREDCTVGFETSGTIGFFGSVKGCNFHMGVISAKAMSASDYTGDYHPYTGGSECHAYSTSTTVIQPVYDYCQNAKGSEAVEPKKRTAKRTVSNSGSVETTVDNTPTPPTVNPPTQEPPVITKEDKCTAGNPGNHKCKGNAGEDPNGKGTMPADSTNGNGQHGNQGQGGYNQP